jgi:hypothetical protein
MKRPSRRGSASRREPGLRGRLRQRLIQPALFAALGAAVLLLAGCRGGSEADPTTTTSASPSPTASSAGPTASQEASDRAAVQAAWAAYWHVVDTLLAQPEASWPTAVAKVAVDPIYSEQLNAARFSAAKGLIGYGATVNHPYWTKPIGDKGTAQMWDCLDGSHEGSMVAKTGVKKTVGTKNAVYLGTFVKGTDGVWRVRQVTFYQDRKCTS